MIKRFLGMVLLSLIITPCFGSFSDIVDDPYATSISYLEEKKIVQGYPDGMFKPDQSVTRAEILKIVLESTIDINWTIDHIFDCFPDATDQRYAVYVCYAKQASIVKGYPDGMFKPDKFVTVAEGIKIALEAFDAPVQEDQGPRWYGSYIAFVHNNNIFSQYALNPDRTITRGEMAYLVHQLLLEKKGERSFTNQRSNKSPGCFLPKQPDNMPETSWVDGIEREYITTIGSRYDQNTPSELIFAFHGRTNSNAEVHDYYNLDNVWDKKGIIVYPAGLPAGNGRGWNNPGDKPENLRDFALFDQLVSEFTNNYCIDMDRIYVVGHSLGARFTNTLACARGDVIRAMGTVGGSITPNTCSGPTAAIIMHNPKDNLASFGGGEYARNKLLEQNQCNPDTYATMGNPVGGNCIKYTDCLDGAPVVWCPHTQDYGRGSYYPHNWPDFAAQTIWNFFEENQ